MGSEDLTRFRNLTFEGFRELACDPSLTRYERIGFPNSYREGKEEDIFIDILGKLPNLAKNEKTVLDIGPGCSELPYMLIEQCRNRGHKLILIDSEEMLQLLPDEPFIKKIPACFPAGCRQFISEYVEKVDVILTYSVFHYVFAEMNPFDFLDSAISLLCNNGEMLIGDIPNISKRKRFFSSPTGVAFHRNFTGRNDTPEVRYNTIDFGEVDDSVLFSLMQRCRMFGCDAYLMPQADNLPMANRREDFLIKKP
ncbi:SAM-dependent methyltransferase [Heliobacterium gestii]|uniref:SAM-dependent methyltransferase n=1 Tax=Heliomicrobium gestii TaxID=2699 RepID=A0A845LDU2_HELGE|nr:SAM-dependent methyltransferase [Heliomicrobium gestii]MBM7866620.1 hypothetical protein [Heliomicrobium gestii]MZP43100.1 SAM-dependent methyltransferase [Heliomicrobium gestii]